MRTSNTDRGRPAGEGAPRVELTERDRRLLEALTLKVRLLSEAQIARAFWHGAPVATGVVRRRIAQLAAAGLVERLVVLAHPELDLRAPLATWKPGTPPPDWGALAYLLRARWTAAVRATRIIIATAQAGAWLGGSGGRAPRRSEATHDLHLAAVYLRMLDDAPQRARRWVSEARLLAAGEGRHAKLPDAIIRHRGGSTAIEFAGAYSSVKLMEFHEHCQRHHLAYELW